MKHLKINSKVNAPHWSLQAGETCPGSMTKEGVIIAPCKVCYAKGGFYQMTNVKEVRKHNKEVWKDSNFVGEMVQELDEFRYMRWFDSGDIYHPLLACKIYFIILKSNVYSVNKSTSPIKVKRRTC